MTLSVHSSQSDLAAGGVFRPVPLVKLTTYTDRAAETVDEEFYFSDRAVTYDYGNTGADKSFWPVLSGRWMDGLRETINHVSDPVNSSGFAKSFTLRLSNVEIDGGAYLSEQLRASNLDLARVEVAEILLSTDRSDSDLSDLTGDEYVVRFRGDLVRYFIGDLIDLRFESVIPPMPWVYADDETINDPIDVGKRLPIIIGSPKRVECIGWNVGWVTTLAEKISKNRSNRIELTDVSGFPTSGTFQVLIGDEEITLQDADTNDNTVEVVQRGANDTDKARHLQGDAVVELPLEVVYIVSSQPSQSVDKIFIKNPINDELFAIPNSVYSVTLADQSLISGQSVTSIRFDRLQLREVMNDAFVATRVTTQPEFSSSTSTTTHDDQPASRTISAWTNLSRGNRVTISGSVGSTRLTYSPTGVDHSARCFFPDSQSIPADVVTNMQIRVIANFQNTTGNTYTLWCSTLNFPDGSFHDHSIVKISSNATSSALIETSRNERVNRGTTRRDLRDENARLTFWVTGNMAAGDYVELTGAWGVRSQETVTKDVDRVQDVDIQAASVGYGLRLFANVTGAVVPAPDVTEFYDFDDETNWNVDDCVHAEETIGGRTGQKMTRAAATVRYDCNLDSGNWTVGSACTIADATIGGFPCVEMTSTSSSGAAWMHRVFAGPEDWQTDHVIAFETYFDNANSLPGGLKFWLVNSTIPTWDDRTGYEITGPSHDLKSGVWQTIVIDTNVDVPFKEKGSSLDLTSLTALTVHANIGTGPSQDVGSGRKFYFRDFRVIPREWTMQKNDLATEDFDSVSDEYEIAVRTSSVAAIDQITVYFSNTAGSGTTPPADRFEIIIQKNQLSDDAWVVISPAQAVAVGSPGIIDSVQTVGVIARSFSTFGVETEAEVTGQPVVHIDDLRGRNAGASNPYDAAVGAVVEKPPDVVRYVLREIVGLPATAIGSSWAAAVTALGSNVVAGDLRWFGQTLSEILQRIAYEQRITIVTEETQAETVWELYAATHDTGPDDFTWPAASGSITEWQRFAEEGRAALTLTSRFVFFYKFDASLGSSNEDAFRKIARANPDATDLVVPTTSELQSIEDIYGRRDAEPFFLRTINIQATAEEVAAYIAHEAIRIATVFVITGVPWTQTFQLQRNDITDVTPPWKSSSSKVRVLEVERDLTTGLANVRAVEVD